LYQATYNAYQNDWTAQDALAVGNQWRDMGDTTRALPYWRNSFTQQSSVELGRQIADLLIMQGDYAEAQDTLQIAYALNPNDIPLNATLGFLLAPSDPQSALVHLQKVQFDDRFGEPTLQVVALITQGVPEPAYSAQVGAILAANQYYGLAEAAYRYAVARNYPYPEAMAQVGYMRVLQGKEGISWARQATELDPANVGAWLGLALVQRALNAPDDAVNSLSIAISLAPDDLSLVEQLAAALDQAGRTDEAQQWRERAEATETP
jgi:tetratricopeptide (TPR) repeat protein